jgi:hypothetical protein
VVIFTKFDGLIVKEYSVMDSDDTDMAWDKAKENAEEYFQAVYLPKVMDTKYPPQAYLQLSGKNGENSLHKDHTWADMDSPEMNCPELTEKTAYPLNIALSSRRTCSQLYTPLTSG